MRLIDANAYKRILEGWISGMHSGEDEQDAEGSAIFSCICQLDDAPTVDAEPVVRCKDCQNWKRNVGLTDSPNGHCFEHDIDTNGRDFCSYGERMRQAKRDEGGNENG